MEDKVYLLVPKGLCSRDIRLIRASDHESVALWDFRTWTSGMTLQLGSTAIEIARAGWLKFGLVATRGSAKLAWTERSGSVFSRNFNVVDDTGTVLKATVSGWNRSHWSFSGADRELGLLRPVHAFTRRKELIVKDASWLPVLLLATSQVLHFAQQDGTAAASSA